MSVNSGKRFFMSVCIYIFFFCDGYFAACNRVIVWCDVVLCLLCCFRFMLTVCCYAALVTVVLVLILVCYC